MGGSKYSGKVTKKEAEKSTSTSRKPESNGVLTTDMVNFELTENVNNVSSNKYSSAVEVARVVAKGLRDDYGDDGYKSSGNTVRLGETVIKIVEDKSRGIWAPKKIRG